MADERMVEMLREHMTWFYAGTCVKCKRRHEATVITEPDVEAHPIIGITCACDPVAHVAMTRQNNA